MRKSLSLMCAFAVLALGCIVPKRSPAEAKKPLTREEMELLFRSQEDRFSEALARLSGRISELAIERDETSGVRAPIAARAVQVIEPVVKLYGTARSGAGVIVERRQAEGRDEYEYFVLTTLHIVMDAHNEPQDASATVFRGEEQFSVTCFLHLQREDMDIALLRFHSREVFEKAVLPSPAALRSIVRFTQVYNVGCPNREDPYPTRGEIVNVQKVVNGQRHFLITAPGYFGSSGGGVFLEDSHELIGIYSKVSTYLHIQSDVVAQIGYVIPLDAISAWLDGIGHGSLVRAPKSETADLSQREDSR